MASLRYLHLDVFTDTPFEGNQLAVFPEPPRDLSAALMQRIAAEMNFSESTFVFPAAAGGDIAMRIFTPAEELPIAGHPTIGTTFALAAEKVIPAARESVVFELGVGPTPVSLEWKDGRLDFAWMTQPLPSFGNGLESATFAAPLGVTPEDVVRALPAQRVSCGVPFLLVPLGTREAVDRVSVERRALAAACRASGLEELPVLVFTTDRTASNGAETIYSRMLAPGFGITEDPATGSAAGPLGSYLVRHRVLDAQRARSFVNLQGAAMRRPSRISISIGTQGDAITGVRVGGRAVAVGSGKLEW